MAKDSKKPTQLKTSKKKHNTNKGREVNKTFGEYKF